MKIGELIKLLSAYPADYDVLLETTKGHHDIKFVYSISDYKLVGITVDEDETIYVDLPSIGDSPDDF